MSNKVLRASPVRPAWRRRGKVNTLGVVHHPTFFDPLGCCVAVSAVVLPVTHSNVLRQMHPGVPVDVQSERPSVATRWAVCLALLVVEDEPCVRVGQAHGFGGSGSGIQCVTSLISSCLMVICAHHSPSSL